MSKHLNFWWLTLLLVLLLGTMFLATGYDAGLPLYESADESHNLNEIFVLRGLNPGELRKPGYPPGILYVNYAAQLLIELGTGRSAWDQACLVIQSLRLSDIAFNLMSALLIALISRKLGGGGAGILAALAWLVAPRVLQQNQFIFPQVYESLFYLLAVYMMMLSLEKQQPVYALLSVVAGLSAVIFKYAIFPVLGLGVGAALSQLQSGERHWLRTVAIQMSAIALVAVALVTLGSATSLPASGHAETANFFSGGLGHLLEFERLNYFFTQATNQIGLSPLLFITLVSAGSLFLWMSSPIWQRLGWLAILALALSHIFFMVTYVSKLDLDRNMLSSSGLLVIMVSVSLMLIGRWIIAHSRLPQLVVQGVIAGFAFYWLIPQLANAWAWVHYRDLPVTYGAMAAWINQHLPEEKIIVSDRRPFSRQWSCDLHNIPRPTDRDLMSRSIDEWLARDVYYVQLTQSRVAQMRDTPQGRAYLDRMTLRQQFPPPEEADNWRTWRRGHQANIAIYQLWPAQPAFPAITTFGGQIRLFGYDLDFTDITPGTTFTMRFYWQTVQPPASDYNVFVHLIAEDDPNTILAQNDGVPSRSSLRPTSTWHDLDELFISNDFPLVVPDDLEPGAYRLEIGLYDWRTGERLLTDEGQDWLLPMPKIAYTRTP